jgi:MFS family permease
VLQSGGVMPLARPAIAALGASQCVFWGILYYAFAVLLVPIGSTFNASATVVAGAFSLGLAVSAVLAPLVGRWLDRGHGLTLLRGGAMGAAGLLWLWSQIHGIAALYAVWFGLGITMALVLYETAFAILTRAIDDNAARLRALASVTVFGGLASTIFLPLVGAGVTHFGWRTTLQLLVAIWLVAVLAIERWLAPSLQRSALPAPPPTPAAPAPIATALLIQVSAPFVLATFATMAVTTVLIPALVAEGHALTSAASVLSMLGIMQLPGRIGLWRGIGRITAPGLLLVPLLLQMFGLGVLAMSASLPGAVVGVAVIGLGAGLHTVARPWVVPQIFGVQSAGRANGAIARAQGIARASGPLMAVAAYGQFGRQAVFGALALCLLLCCPIALATAQRCTHRRD